MARGAGVTSSRGTKRNSHATMQRNAIQADELQRQGSGGGQQPGPCLHRKIGAAGMHDHGRRRGADDAGPWHPARSMDWTPSTEGLTGGLLEGYKQRVAGSDIHC